MAQAVRTAVLSIISSPSIAAGKASEWLVLLTDKPGVVSKGVSPFLEGRANKNSLNVDFRSALYTPKTLFDFMKAASYHGQVWTRALSALMLLPPC
jgi:hypothetical protein